VGKVAIGKNVPMHTTRLTPNEQITHITLWSMLSAPLLIGCDLSNLDNFTLKLLSNDEVLAVNQDALGKPATRLSKNGLTEVWSRPLSDGTVAVAFFNRSIQQQPIKVSWTELKLTGPQLVRDLWEQSDRGTFPDSFQCDVPSHGSRLFKIGTPTQIPPAIPTENPAANPTAIPTENPAAIPAEMPTRNPTAIPTENPAAIPTEMPTQIQTKTPTETPTQQ
jgi:alpha-galactosidase